MPSDQSTTDSEHSWWCRILNRIAGFDVTEYAVVEGGGLVQYFECRRCGRRIDWATSASDVDRFAGRQDDGLRADGGEPQETGMHLQTKIGLAMAAIGLLVTSGVLLL